MNNIPKSIVHEKKSKRIGNQLKATDDNFKILLNVVMGIQLAVQATPNIVVKEEDDYSNYFNSLYYSIQTTHYGSKQEIFYIKEYAGIIFNNIRKLYDINKDTFISSISPQDFITGIIVSGSTIIEELCSTGKSGSLFYYTRDGKFIIKTVSETEYLFLKKILPNYFKHLKNNKHSMLPKFLGAYTLVRKTKSHKKKTNFIIMQNIFSTSRDIHIRYDLKGSKIGRQVLVEDNKSKLEGKCSFALKDLDLENLKQYFFVGDKKNPIMDQLKSDTKFLAENNIIDYSLLVGIHNLSSIDQQNFNIMNKEKTVRFSSNSKKKLDLCDGGSEVGSPFKNYQRQSQSLNEKIIKPLKIEEEVQNFSQNSLYNYDIKYSEGSQNGDEAHKTELNDQNKHPFRSVSFYFNSV
jgi:1-phosphatidylinositol-4-phosphate 5-kinase